jgi:hypothetical protein
MDSLDLLVVNYGDAFLLLMVRDSKHSYIVLEY